MFLQHSVSSVGGCVVQRRRLLRPTELLLSKKLEQGPTSEVDALLYTAATSPYPPSVVEKCYTYTEK